MNFENLNLSGELVTVIDQLGFNKPTQIQEQSIPHIMKGKDVIGESATGSGKTLAFGCGVIEQVLPGNGLQALILAPTRELAEQVKENLREISQTKKLSIIAVYGGVSINPQINDLKKADVVVGTPGRLMDHLDRGTINMSSVRMLVLDEADRMLDMGFIDDVEKIISQCPKERQTLFFSATISSDIKNLAGKYMREPEKVSAKRYVDPSKLKQVYYDVHKGIKLSLLVHLLKNENFGLVMVFCNSRRNVDFVAKNLKINGVKAVSIHGGLSQNKRSRTIDMFNKGKVEVLICTDVAARGLHIADVSHVYNYDLPKDSNDYVHRIGRTARAGSEGMVVNLLAEFDHDNFFRIRRDYDFVIEKMDRPYVQRVSAVRDGFNRRGNHRRFNNTRGFGGARFKNG